ncbi:MAG TPA: hydroxymethylbilane synthase, partial [Nitrososphaerales archaeon]|nr:hydroxymethylbilane synthase [Nitrososphaerales archaeon]
MKETIRIGTRGSKLALAQAEIVVSALRARHSGIEVKVVQIKTLGDLLPPSRAKEVDGKAAFTGALEEALMKGEVDAAVHSLKDLPNDIEQGLTLGATPRRGDHRDALVSKKGLQMADVPAGGRIGTSSLRRKAQLLAMRPELEVVEVRGNVETRVSKLEHGDLDGIVLAYAGLARIGLSARVTQVFDPEVMVPAVCQGTVGVEARADDS